LSQGLVSTAMQKQGRIISTHYKQGRIKLHYTLLECHHSREVITSPFSDAETLQGLTPLLHGVFFAFQAHLQAAQA